MKIKRIFRVIISVLLIITSMEAIVKAEQNYVKSNDIKIFVNNSEVKSEEKPVVIDGTTFVPVRSVVEAMGCEVVWDADQQVINFRSKTVIIAMQIGNNKISKIMKNKNEDDPEILDCPLPPRIIEGRTYIPLRDMAKAMNADVIWKPETKTIYITIVNGENSLGNSEVVKSPENKIYINGELIPNIQFYNIKVHKGTYKNGEPYDVWLPYVPLEAIAYEFDYNSYVAPDNTKINVKYKNKDTSEAKIFSFTRDSRELKIQKRYLDGHETEETVNCFEKVLYIDDRLYIYYLDLYRLGIDANHSQPVNSIYIRR